MVHQLKNERKKNTINKTNFALATSTVISFQCRTNAEIKCRKKQKNKSTTQVWTQPTKLTFYKQSVNIKMSKHTLPPVFFFSSSSSEITTASS